MVSALNGVNDLTVKAVSCKMILNEYIRRFNLSPVVAKHFGELVACGLLMGSSLKGEESLQISFVGSQDALIRSMLVVVDGAQRVKGTISNPEALSNSLSDEITSIESLFGKGGDIRIVKNHPTWKHPMNSIVLMQNTSISLNLALYLAHSEQRSGVFVSDIIIGADKSCTVAATVLVECLPDCRPESVNTAIENLNYVDKRKLSSYFLDEGDENSALNSIVDDCLLSMEKGSSRWNGTPKFACECSLDKVWRSIRLLPKVDIDEIVNENTGVEVGSILVCFSFFADLILLLDDLWVLCSKVQHFFRRIDEICAVQFSDYLKLRVGRNLVQQVVSSLCDGCAPRLVV
jgi:molecular chaperone Hsp33